MHIIFRFLVHYIYDGMYESQLTLKQRGNWKLPQVLKLKFKLQIYWYISPKCWKMASTLVLQRLLMGKLGLEGGASFLFLFCFVWAFISMTAVNCFQVSLSWDNTLIYFQASSADAPPINRIPFHGFLSPIRNVRIGSSCCGSAGYKPN